MKCPECGTENRLDATFCASCGTRLPAQVSDQPADQGKPATRDCPSCGTELHSEASFCHACGQGAAKAAPTQDYEARSVQEWISLIKKGAKGLKPLQIAGLSFLGVLVVAAIAYAGYSWATRDRAAEHPVASQTPSDGQDTATQADPPPSNTPRPSSTPRPTNTTAPDPTPVTRVSSTDGMVQVYVPAGNFLMGSTEQELEALGFDPDDFRDEFPQHEVYLDAYWIDQTEVTNAMFAAFLNERGNQVENGNTWLQADSEALRIHQQGGVWVTDPGYENHPVLGVRWYGAQAYCEWAGRRLPTEAEWEKAARGTEGQIYPWGNGSPSCNLANYRGCTGETAEVGSYPGGMSPSGALDMAGNVVEWVSDRYGETYYSSSPTNNPQGPTSGYMRVMRGGSWNLHPEAARVARRYWGATAYPDNNKTGVRCAEDASGTDTPAPTRDPQSMSPPDPPQPLTPPPLSFTFSPTTGPAGSQVELYLNTAMLDINVYYDGQLIPKSVSPDGRTLTVRIPGTAVGSSYFDLCWDGGCVAATEPFIVTPTNANLLLSNKSGQTICFLYISPSDQTTWGNDWLGGETMPSPSFDVFTVPQSGFYDFKVEDCTHNLIDHRYGRFLGSYYWEILP